MERGSLVAVELFVFRVLEFTFRRTEFSASVSFLINSERSLLFTGKLATFLTKFVWDSFEISCIPFCMGKCLAAAKTTWHSKTEINFICMFTTLQLNWKCYQQLKVVRTICTLHSLLEFVFICPRNNENASLLTLISWTLMVSQNSF